MSEYLSRLAAVQNRSPFMRSQGFTPSLSTVGYMPCMSLDTLTMYLRIAALMVSLAETWHVRPPWMASKSSTMSTVPASGEWRSISSTRAENTLRRLSGSTLAMWDNKES